MNIYDFFQGAIRSVEQWLAVHYDREAWARDHTSKRYVQRYFAEVCGFLSNVHYLFEWHRAALKRDPNLGKDALWNSLVNEGFDTYAAAVHQRTDRYKDEAILCLKAIQGAGNPEDLVAACMWMLKLKHATGNLIGDDRIYGPTWEKVRAGGLLNAFPREQVEDFINGRTPGFVFNKKLLEKIEKNYPVEE